MTIPAEDKRALRAAAKTARAAAKAATPDAPARLSARFLATIPIPKDAIVGGYWPIGDEIDVLPLLAALHDRGIALALPVVAAPGQPLSFQAWRPGDEMTPGAHGIPVPLSTAALVNPHLLIVPLLAFDAQGWRLGYGAGYYDRTLERLGDTVTSIGVAYAVQRVERVPRDAGDRPLDAVVTEAAAHWVKDHG